MALVVVSNTPLANETDVVLQSNIVVTFDAPVLTGSVNDNTFVVSSEGATRYRDANQSLPFDESQVKNYSDTDFIEGVLSFSSDMLTVTFTPTKVFKPRTTYTVLLGGYDIGALESKYILSYDRTTYLETSVQWSFSTGELDVAEPPSKSDDITYEELIAELNALNPDYVEPSPTGYAVVSPESGSFNVALVDDVLFTFTSPIDIVDLNIVPKVYLVDQADPLKTKKEVPVTYELQGTRIIKVKFA